MKHVILSWFLYILKSKVCEKFYTGISQNPERRLNFHNTFEKGFTSRYRPWELVFMKGYDNRSEAQFAEKKIKKLKSKLVIKKILSGLTEL
jgi:predicted GIY-YIG superfamily endonuclease